LREKLFPRQLSIPIAVQLFQHLTGILQFLRIDHPIVIGIQQIEERRPPLAPVTGTAPARTIRPRTISLLSIRPRPIRPLPSAISRWRQSLRRIRWLRRHRLGRRGIVLRAKHYGRQRQ
jgi:hypothetical protein